MHKTSNDTKTYEEEMSDEKKLLKTKLELQQQLLLKKLRDMGGTLPRNTADLTTINDFGVFKIVYGEQLCLKTDLEHIFLFSATNGIVRNVEYLLPLVQKESYDILMNVSFGEAAKYNHFQVLKLFDTKIIDVDYDDSYAMRHSIMGDYTETVKYLVENGAAVTLDMIVSCCENGDNRDIMEILVKTYSEPLSTYYQKIIVLCLDRPDRSAITEFLITYVDPKQEDQNCKLDEFLYGSYQDALFEREIEYADFTAEESGEDTDA